MTARFNTKQIEILDKVATWLEAGAPEKDNRGMKFDMDPLVIVDMTKSTADENWCGTACCIAGAIVSMGDPDFIAKQLSWDIALDRMESDEESQWHVDGIWERAKEMLEINEDMSTDLFVPRMYGEGVQSDLITPTWAAKTIRHFMATGEVEWLRFKPEEVL